MLFYACADYFLLNFCAKIVKMWKFVYLCENYNKIMYLKNNLR